MIREVFNTSDPGVMNTNDPRFLDDRRVEVVEVDGYRCFQPNVKRLDEDNPDWTPLTEDIADERWGDHTLVLLYPSGWDPDAPTSFPLFVHMEGTSAQYVEATAIVPPPGDPQRGISWGIIAGAGRLVGEPGYSREAFWTQMLTSSVTFQTPPAHPAHDGSEDSFVSALRLDRDGGWGILLQAQCSQDGYAGVGELTVDSRRYSLAAAATVIRDLERRALVDYVHFGGNSGGGVGAGIYARALDDHIAGPVRSAVISAGAPEIQPIIELNEQLRQHGGYHAVPADVAAAPEAVVQCGSWLWDRDWSTAVQRSGLDAYLSAASDVETGRIHIPIYLTFSHRDSAHGCFDKRLMTGEQGYNQPFIQALLAMSPSPVHPHRFQINYDQGTDPACPNFDWDTLTCNSDQPIMLDGTRHGQLSVNRADVLDWLAKVDAAYAAALP